MMCPRCGQPMEERDFGGVHVDVCETGCRGLWLDWGELAELDDPGEGFGREFVSAVEAAPIPAREGRIRCTRCDMPMHEHRNGSGSHVLVDECYGCRGFYLDPGELQAIRDEVAEQQTRSAKIEDLLFNEPTWRAHRLELECDQERTRAAVKLRSLLMHRVPWWVKLWVAWPS